MKVCSHKGVQVAVLTRNEHCPPHVHAGTPAWDARFEFSFWHNGVRLWDVSPAQNEPNAAVLEALRQVLKQSQVLHRARTLWWRSRGTLCLERQHWDAVAEEAVSPQSRRLGTVPIQSARFDPLANKTVLHLTGQPHPLEIEL